MVNTKNKANSYLVKALVALNAHLIFCSFWEKMVTKIVPFRVVFATTEDDEEHEANELLTPGPDTRGWASDAYCIYPQVIFLFHYMQFLNL